MKWLTTKYNWLKEKKKKREWEKKKKERERIKSLREREKRECASNPVLLSGCFNLSLFKSHVLCSSINMFKICDVRDPKSDCNWYNSEYCFRKGYCKFEWRRMSLCSIDLTASIITRTL